MNSMVNSLGFCEFTDDVTDSSSGSQSHVRGHAVHDAVCGGKSATEQSWICLFHVNWIQFPAEGLVTQSSEWSQSVSERTMRDWQNFHHNEWMYDRQDAKKSSRLQRGSSRNYRKYIYQWLKAECISQRTKYLLSNVTCNVRLLWLLYCNDSVLIWCHLFLIEVKVSLFYSSYLASLLGYLAPRNYSGPPLSLQTLAKRQSTAQTGQILITKFIV